MRISKITVLTVCLGLLLSFAWIVSPVSAAASDENEKPRGFSAWIHSLPSETRIQVEQVFERNMGCWENAGEESVPDHNEWIASLHRDLEPVLTSGQFKAFKGLWSSSPGSQLSVTRTTCGDCGSALTKLNQAYGYLSSALSYYDADYCDFGFYPDNVYGCIVAAKLRTDLASDYASNAYNTCNCTSAQDALDEALEAKQKLDCAIDNTSRYCDSDSPWKNYLSSASIWLNLAISKLYECVDEACN